MVLTSFFTTRRDWQRREFSKASFKSIRGLYMTAMQNGLNVTIVYDDLPAEFIGRYSSPRFVFERVRMLDYDWHYGVNDVRYFFYNSLVHRHPEWHAVFMVDAFDVQVRMNPCGRIMANTLYVGAEAESLKGHPWIERRFQRLGGDYLKWYQSDTARDKTILNCGLTGGWRGPVLEFLHEMTAVLADPELAVRHSGETINLNMAALNYVVYTNLSHRFNISSGAPMHSSYKAYEKERNDVWFIHK